MKDALSNLLLPSQLSNPRLPLPPPCWYHMQQLRQLLVLLVFSQLQYMYPQPSFLLLKPQNHMLVSHPTASPVGATVTQAIQTLGGSVAPTSIPSMCPVTQTIQNQV